MLILKKAPTRTGSEIASIQINGECFEDLLNKEWLLTNNRGGYSSSTIVGCNTSRYHGLLIGSLNPPVNRIMALSHCLETVIFSPMEGEDHPKRVGQKTRQASRDNVFNLGTFEFEDKFAPEKFSCIKRFRRDAGVHFEYQLPELKLTKSVYLLPDSDVVVLVYDFACTRRVKRSIKFILRPFIGLRDFHSLQRSYASLYSRMSPEGLLVRHDVPESCELRFAADGMEFEDDEQWWFDFVYRNDKRRGYHYTEDLWTPGFYQSSIDSTTRVVLQAGLYPSCGGGPINQEALGSSQRQAESVCEFLPSPVVSQAQVLSHQDKVISAIGTKDKKLKVLSLAADQFIVNRQRDHTQRTTILAGFPWFADWGRDCFVALPGLLLETRRYEEAKSVLTTFAQGADNGMIPNRFDDLSGTAYFNSIDASLWFINASFQYLELTGDTKTFTQYILPTIRWIIEFYQKGTRFNIHADEDGLITGGSEQTQLTWMDAKYNGVALTPRHGKAVEINSLWYNSLCWLVHFYDDRNPEVASHYKSMADKVETSFSEVFWNDNVGYLNDCILPEPPGSWRTDSSLRPNQILAVSLPYSALSKDKQRAVVEVVKNKLLTPYGLRTLAPDDARYKGRYTGSQEAREQAYHQGTAWPYLIGPFVEAYLKVNNFSRKSKKEAAVFIEPLLQSLTEGVCIGQLAEIFDGDEPYESNGCIAQACNVAELIRAYKLINS